MHLVLFDIDGTLVRGGGIGTAALLRAYQEIFARDPADHPAVRKVFIAGSTDTRILREMARAFTIPDDEFESARSRLIASYLGHLQDRVDAVTEYRLLPGLPEVLERLAAREDVVLGLLTGNLEAGARIKLGRFDLNRFFRFGGFGDDHHERHGMAEIAWERAEAITGDRVPPDRVVVVGDTEHDVHSTRPHGFLSAAVLTGWAGRDALLASEPTAVFEDLTPAHGFETWLAERWGWEEPPAG